MSPILRTVTNKEPSSRKKEKNFAEHVHKLLTEVNRKDPAMIQWVCNGEAFTVDTSHPDLGDALAKYFHHSKYSSFQRQLNQYGWTKPRSGKYTGTFYNPLFHRETQLEDIRKISRGGRKQHATNENTSKGQKVTPSKSSTIKDSYKRSSSKTTNATIPQEPIANTLSSGRRRLRLPLQKKNAEPDFEVVKGEIEPLTPRTIEFPSVADIRAVQVLLGMIRNPLPVSEECSSIASSDGTTSKAGNDRPENYNFALVVPENYNFAVVVHELVTEMDVEDPTMIRWIDNGSAFVIDPSHPRLGNALAKYFHHSKYSSFQRQLNQYGWCKHRNTGKFYNHLFHRDTRRSKFDLIQRKDKKNEGTSSSSIGSKRSRSKAILGCKLPNEPEELEVDDMVPNKRRRLSSFSKKPQLASTSDEETSSSDEDSFGAHQPHQGYFLDLSDASKNVMTYLSNPF